MKDAASLSRVSPELSAVTKISEEYDLIGHYLFSPETQRPERDAGSRMFAPRYGINEESATGMAAGPLACFLHGRMKVNKELLLIEQGHLMSPASPSLIMVKLEVQDGKIGRLLAGGTARVMTSAEVVI